MVRPASLVPMAHPRPRRTRPVRPVQERKKAMIDHETNLLPKNLHRKVTFLGTARCSEASPQCISVGRLENGDTVLANIDGQVFKIPAGETEGVAALISQALQP